MGEIPVAMSENVVRGHNLPGSQEYDILFPMVLAFEFVYQIGVTCFTSGIEQFVSRDSFRCYWHCVGAKR